MCGIYYSSIPKLQRLYRWSLGMDKLFHHTLYWVCDYLSMSYVYPADHGSLWHPFIRGSRAYCISLSNEKHTVLFCLAWVHISEIKSRKWSLQNWMCDMILTRIVTLILNSATIRVNIISHNLTLMPIYDDNHASCWDSNISSIIVTIFGALHALCDIGIIPSAAVGELRVRSGNRVE